MEDRLPRKLAAILYADVAGYSRLTGDDEEGTHRRLREYLDLLSASIEQHQGKVVHYAGDAVLAEFGTVTEALTSATDIQRELAGRNEDLPDERKVEFRIGVNLGEVIVDRDDIYGDGVNVAARLEALADPGGISISDAVRTAVGKRLDLTYEDMGEQRVKNINEPVRAYKVVMAGGEQPKASPATKPLSDLPDRASIAVLAFTNMSGDPEQEFFCDGITEDIITELSRFPVLSGISRQSSFAFKGEKVGVGVIGQKLGVQYVVEGSVRRLGNRARITAQLIEAETGNHLWAERYDRELDDIFAVQDEVTRAIVATIAAQLGKTVSEKAARKHPASIKSYEYFLQGNRHYYRFNPDDNVKAAELLEKAVELDPQFARAYAGLANTYTTDHFLGWQRRKNALENALECARKALELDSNDPLARTILAGALWGHGRWEEADLELDRAMSLNPGDADLLAELGHSLCMASRLEEGIPLLKETIRLNPLFPDSHRSG